MAALPFYLQTHLVKRFRVGTRKTDAANNTYAYGKGVASLAAGDFVSIDNLGVTTRTLAATTGVIAVAMVANVLTTSYSWFLVDGVYNLANVATHAAGAGKALFLSATAGRVSTTPLTESTAYGAFSAGNSVSNVGAVFIRNPVAPGDIST
jgi:hypothetical protein